ncbi:site-specific integrase [Aquifex pyrophilus]
MEHFIDAYISELRKARDEKTVEKKSYLLKHFLEYSDDLPSFSRREIFSFYEYLKGKNLKDTTIRDVFKEVRLFYEWLSEQGIEIEFDQKALRKLFQSKKAQEALKSKKKYYSDEEINLILNAIRGAVEGVPAKHPIYYVLTIFLLCSGLRISEAVKVRKKDFEVKRILTEEGKEKEVWFVKVREGKFSKERKALIYFFKPEWKKIFEEKLKRLKPDDLFFTYSVKYPKSVKTYTLTDRTAKWFYWKLEKELREKGYDLEVNAHRFRNTYITKLATKGFPVNLIAEWSGHSRISTTMDVYMEAEKERQMEVILEKI